MPVDEQHYTAELREALTNLGLKHHEVEHILHNNDDHKMVLHELLTCGVSFAGVPNDELPSHIDEYFGLNERSHFTATTLIASNVSSVRDAILAGKLNMEVQYVADLVLVGACVGDDLLELPRELPLATFRLNGHQRMLIQTLIFQFGVTVDRLRAANATPDGCMGVFTPPIRALIKRTMPTVPALLDHVLAKVESSRAAAQITASRKRNRVLAQDPGVIQEPDHAALLCDETIDDLAPECSTDRPDGKTASPDHEEASGNTTPPRTKMSKQARFDLTCAPRKMRPKKKGSAGTRLN